MPESQTNAPPPSCETDRVQPGAVVVGFDGSSGSEIALAWADRHAGAIGPVIAAACWNDPWERSAAGVLLDMAADARLLVVGSRGRGRIVGSFVGSTSLACAQHSSVPVAIVPGGVDPGSSIERIAVGVDGSEHSLEALRWVLRFMPPTAMIEVVFTWTSLPMASSLTGSELDRVRVASEHFLDAVVGRVVAEEGACGRPIRRRLSMGDPAEALLAVECSMIVVGSKSDDGLASLFRRSPADSLAGSARTVTVFVPHAPPLLEQHRADPRRGHHLPRG